MYEVGTTTSVTAFHVMPGLAGPEGERHSHDYRISVLVRRDDLAAEGWVCDLDVLGAALGKVTGNVVGRDLTEVIAPPTGAVTVEVFARWLHDSLASTIAEAGGEWLSVRVYESDVDYGGYAGPAASSA
jgi:6-pyruvoyltetrahydropterin/6-carboxytetrahydropterin synthase